MILLGELQTSIHCKHGATCGDPPPSVMKVVVRTSARDLNLAMPGPLLRERNENSPGIDISTPELFSTTGVTSVSRDTIRPFLLFGCSRRLYLVGLPRRESDGQRPSARRALQRPCCRT